MAHFEAHGAYNDKDTVQHASCQVKREFTRAAREEMLKCRK